MSNPPGGQPHQIHDGNDSDDSVRAESPARRGGNSSEESDKGAAAGEVNANAPAAAEEEKKEAAPEIFSWRIPVNKWREENRERVQSPEFTLDGEKWQLLCFPRGNPNHSANGIFAAYIELKDPRAWYQTPATFKMGMLHPTDPTKITWRDSQHTFTPTDKDRGFNDLLTKDNLAEYTHPDGCVVLQIQAFKSAITSSYGYNYVAYDSKASTGFCGLLNQGATCYMNSMLQALFLLPKFREVVYHIPSDADDRGAKIGFALQKVFHALQTGNKGVSTKQLTSSFGWGGIESFQQHDVQEFCRVLLDSLDTTTKKTSLGGVIASLFEGKSQAYIKCINVSFTSQRDETYWDLSIQVKGCKTLTDSFKQYVEEEVLDGDNKYRAEGHGLQAARKGTRFLTLPPVLQLQLKRFEYDPMRDAMIKINDRFEFPASFDATQFVSRSEEESSSGAAAEPVLYSLHSVLVHSGGVHGGHYYSFIRPFTANVAYDESPWYKFDDETVTAVTAEDAIAGNYGGNEIAPKFKGVYWNGAARVSTTSAYMLIYVRTSAIQSLIAPNCGNLPATPAVVKGKKETIPKEGALVATDDTKENAVKETKEKVEKTDKDALPTPYPVPIPESLNARFTKEEAADRERQEAKRRALQYMEIRIVSEPQLMASARGVGVDYMCEHYDPTTGHISYGLAGVESGFKALKTGTLDSIAPIIAEKYGIPPERQELWVIQHRKEMPRTAVRIEPQGKHAGRPLEELLKEYNHSAHAPALYLRDIEADSRPKPHQTPLPSAAGSASAAVPVLPEGALTTDNSVILHFKFFDIPSQRMLWLGSAHFAHNEPVLAIREYAAELLRRRIEDDKKNKDSASTDEAALAASLSRLSVSTVDAASTPTFTSDQLNCVFEVNGGRGEHFPFNFLPPPPNDPTNLRSVKPGTHNWSETSIQKTGISNGELCLFNINYTPQQLQAFREAYERKAADWSAELNGAKVASGVGSPAIASPQPPAVAAAAAVAPAAAGTVVSPAPAQLLEPYKCHFSESCISALQYFAQRIVLEFRSIPYTPAKVANSSMSTTTETAVVAPPAVYQRREGIYTLEVLRTASYVDLMSKLAHLVNIDPQRIKVFKPALANDDMPDSQHLASTHWLNLDICAVKDVLPRAYDVPTVFYYSVMEYTWKELEKNVPVTINYNDKHLVLWTWQALVPRNSLFRDLAAPAFAKVEELRRAADPSYVPAADAAVPPMHYFAIDYRQTVRELAPNGSIRELQSYLINNQFTVNLMEDTEEEMAHHSKPQHTERIIWVRRYYPLGGTYWRPAGLPFTFLAKEGETMLHFKARLSQRLNYDESKMKQIEVSVLTQHEFRPIANDTDQPWELLADDLKGTWTCLGLYDPVLKKGNAAGATGNAAFRHNAGAVQFRP